MAAYTDEPYVFLYRKLLKNPIFAHEGLLKVAIWCLLKANRHPVSLSVTTGRGKTVVDLKPGQFLFGRHSAAKELNMKPSTARYRMVSLKKLGFLDMQVDTHYSVVTVEKWGEYQVTPSGVDRQVNTQLTGKQQPTDNQLTQSRVSREKEKKEKKKPASTWLSPFGRVWEEKLGAFPYSKAAKAFSTLLKQNDPDHVYLAWENYVEHADPMFADPVKFAQQWKSWRNGPPQKPPPREVARPADAPRKPVWDA